MEDLEFKTYPGLYHETLSPKTIQKPYKGTQADRGARIQGIFVYTVVRRVTFYSASAGIIRYNQQWRRKDWLLSLFMMGL